MITLFIPGIPRPAGSKRGFAIKKGGKYTGKVALLDSSGQNGKDWRADIKAQAQAAMAKEGRELLTGPVAVWMTFVMPRPKAHHKANNPDRPLKDSAPVYPTGKPDVLKLARAAEDALTGIVWRDDSQNVELTLGKVYNVTPGERGQTTVINPGVRIHIEPAQI